MVGYHANGPYIRVVAAGITTTWNPNVASIDDIIRDISVEAPGVQTDGIREAVDRLSEAKDIFDNFTEAEINNGFQRVYNVATTVNSDWPAFFVPANQCFSSEVPIDMWPLDPNLNPDLDGVYDQDEVRAKIWKKPIELIEVGDIVVSLDENDNLVPGPVTQTFQNEVKIILNFFGTHVTPGHVYYRADSKKANKFETLIDILRDDGVIENRDGVHLRAATNAPVGGPLDCFVKAVTGTRKADGSINQKEAGRIRLGTRFIINDGKSCKSFTVADLIKAGGGVVGEDELIRVGNSDPMPFHWHFDDKLPKPEDFVLACSGITLEDIYKAAEWENQGPRLPAPMLQDRGPVQPLKGLMLSAMPRNEPLEVTFTPKRNER